LTGTTKSKIYRVGADNTATILPAADIAGFYVHLSSIAADAAGNLYLADPDPTRGYGNYPANPKISNVNFLPAIFKLSAATDPDYQTAETLLEDWTTSTVDETSRDSSSNIIMENGAPKMRPRHEVQDYSGIVSIALAKANSDVLLYAARSENGNTPQVLIVPSPKVLHGSISVMTPPGGGSWVKPVSVSVAANQAYGGSDSVFVADEDDSAIFWYNKDSGANSHTNYISRITGGSSSTFGVTWGSGAYTGQNLGSPVAVAVVSKMESMVPRMYIAFSTGGAAYFTRIGSTNTLLPLGEGGANSNGGCPFASPNANNLITSMVVDNVNNLFVAGTKSPSGAEACVCKNSGAAPGSIFVDGESLLSNALESEKPSIAVSCP
jgi:hypothetical protein